MKYTLPPPMRRIPQGMRNITLPLILLSLCAFTVHDGDTFTKISYRMAYIDAPELDQICHRKGVEIPIGELSRRSLATHSDGIVNCRANSVDKYGRIVADCGFNIDMVREGMAICYDQYISSQEVLAACHDAQRQAQAEERGIWQCDDFISPAQWRKK